MLKTEELSSVVDARRLPPPERHMTVTPLDLRQTRFRTTLRGFDRSEVTDFLEEAAACFDHAVRENERLRQEIQRLETWLNQFRQLEGSLKSTLVSAQKVADDMRENATQEAVRIVREAEGKAELLLERMHSRAQDIQRDIDGLRLKRREAESSIESTIATLHNTLDFVRGHDQREDRVVAHWSSTAEVTARPA
jgi:cell division initiation protein